MIELHLRARVQPARRAELETFLRDAIPFYEDSGGISVRVLWDLSDPDRFIEVISYADQQVHDRDQERVARDPQMLARLEQWRSLLAGPPVVETYRVGAG